MEKYTKNPFLPDGKVKTVIVDKRISKCVQNKIRANGINIIETPNCSNLYDSVSAHPDMFIHHVGGDEIIVAPNIYYDMNKKLEGLNLKVIQGDTMLKSTYPDNVAYNVGRIGGIAMELEKYDVDVLMIRSGYIDLPGLDYGFVGGASGLIDNKKILFCGDIRKHPDFKIIKKFLTKYEVSFEFIENKRLIDIGSIIPIMEM